MIRTFAVVDFLCPECGEHVNEGIDGGVFRHLFQEGSTLLNLPRACQCHRCQAIYGLQIETALAPWTATVIGYPDLAVRFDDANDRESDLWLDSTPPEDPFRIFLDSYHRLNDIVSEYGDGGSGALPKSGKVINRMVYAAAIASMEAFLADSLLRTVLSEDFALDRLLANENELKKMTVPLVDIHKNQNIVRDKTREYLATLLYHNLGKVANLYLIAFEFNIFPEPTIKDRLHRAVVKRHDIVHRNGKDVNGGETEIDLKSVYSVLEDIRSLVAHIDNNITNTIIHQQYSR